MPDKIPESELSTETNVPQCIIIQANVNQHKMHFTKRRYTAFGLFYIEWFHPFSKKYRSISTRNVVLHSPVLRSCSHAHIFKYFPKACQQNRIRYHQKLYKDAVVVLRLLDVVHVQDRLSSIEATDDILKTN